MNRIRKTICFKEPIFEKLDDMRGKKSFSTFINDFFEKKLKNILIERR